MPSAHPAHFVEDRARAGAALLPLAPRPRAERDVLGELPPVPRRRAPAGAAAVARDDEVEVVEVDVLVLIEVAAIS
jgi:hypothetical protein